MFDKLQYTTLESKKLIKIQDFYDVFISFLLIDFLISLPIIHLSLSLLSLPRSLFFSLSLSVSFSLNSFYGTFLPYPQKKDWMRVAARPQENANIFPGAA
jgi:hypothetical protein